MHCLADGFISSQASADVVRRCETDRSLRQDLTDGRAFGMAAMESISSIADCVDEAEALALLKTARADLECDSAVFVSAINFEENESFRYMLDAPLPWCSMYRKKGMCATDPWLRYAAENTEPATCAQIAAALPDEPEPLVLARQHGAHSSYILPAPSRAGSSRFGVLILSSHTPGYFDRITAARIKPLARALSMELHAWWIARIRAELLSKLRISEMDLKLLKLENKGHKTKAIAQMLDMSSSAIDTAFHRLSHKLETTTRRASVLKAAAYGLI